MPRRPEQWPDLPRRARLHPLHVAVAEAWRATRWRESGGQMSCPSCYDGEHLEPLPADPRNPALARARCRACDRLVTDVTHTWLWPLKSPLARWAWLLLHDDAYADVGPEFTARKIGGRHHLIRSMRDKLATAPPESLVVWRTELAARGLTCAALEPLLKAAR